MKSMAAVGVFGSGQAPRRGCPAKDALSQFMCCCFSVVFSLRFAGVPTRAARTTPAPGLRLRLRTRSRQRAGGHLGRACRRKGVPQVR
jgi:hypothetical protein